MKRLDFKTALFLNIIGAKKEKNILRNGENKDDFFSKTIIEDKRNKESVKRILASHANEFIDINNPLVKEVEVLLNKEI